MRQKRRRSTYVLSIISLAVSAAIGIALAVTILFAIGLPTGTRGLAHTIMGITGVYGLLSLKPGADIRRRYEAALKHPPVKLQRD